MKRMAIACLPGLQTFIDKLADTWNNNFLIEKVYSNDITQVAQGISNAEILWLEWANEMAAGVTQNLLPLERLKKVVLRLHSYEALTPQYLQAIQWGAITDLVFVSEYIKDYVNGIIPQQLAHLKQHVVPNGLDVSDFKIEEYKNEDSDITVVGMLGHLNNKKGLMLLAQSVAHIHHEIERSQFLIGGDWQDPRYEAYFYHFLEKMDLMDVVDFKKVAYGESNKFFQDVDVVLCTSPWESQNMSVMEGMASGCKPAIHWFPGAEYHYPEEYLWLTFDQLMGIVNGPRDPEKYRKHITAGYDLHEISSIIRGMVLEC
ncbi:MAG: glycosyltransferase family 4 protein [Planctomycetota bacterium]|jgi:glycosyltransferase involved in cell wall biosynthesis